MGMARTAGDGGRHGKTTEEQPILKDETSSRTFDTVCQALREGLFPEAMEALEQLLERDVDHPGAASTLKCAGFWRDRLEKDLADREGFERGDLILAQWRQFTAFAERLPDVPERCMFAVKQHVFSSALAAYLSTAPGGEREADPDVLLQIGRCYKGMGDYERAIESLERANRERRDDARILAELADCYSLVNESRAAKVFFREAFSVDPQAVDLAGLESPLVQRLADRVRARGHTGPDLNEWLPVYGCVWGVFNVKRELKPLELGKLKQAIFHFEKEYGAGGPARALIAPRLINRYLWLIDHYMSTGEPRERVEETLRKIRDISPRVYDEYTT
jgi:tetratricopeptide (TPR) repeat protein